MLRNNLLYHRYDHSGSLTLKINLKLVGFYQQTIVCERQTNLVVENLLVSAMQEMK